MGPILRVRVWRDTWNRSTWGWEVVDAQIKDVDPFLGGLRGGHEFSFEAAWLCSRLAVARIRRHNATLRSEGA